MVDRRLHKEEFEPVVQPNENVEINGKYYVVERIDPIPAIDVDFGALSAGATAKSELDDIKVEDDEFAQYRFIPIDNIDVIEFKQPAGVGRWRTKAGTVGFLPPVTEYPEPHVEGLQLTEFFQHKDRSIEMTVKARTAVSRSRVRFYGYIFTIEQLEEKPDVFLSIPVGGKPRE